MIFQVFTINKYFYTKNNKKNRFISREEDVENI